MLTTKHLKIFLAVFLSLSILFLLANETSHRLPNRALCTGFAVCRLFQDADRYVADPKPNLTPDLDLTQIDAFWNSNPDNPDDWSEEEVRRREIPSYVWDHAPYVHLSSHERFWPSDIAQHLAHSTLYTNTSELDGAPSGLDADAVLRFVEWEDGNKIFLHSEYPTADPPEWLSGIDNIPRGRRPDLDAMRSSLETLSDESSNAQHIRHDDECRSVFGWLGESDGHCTDYCDAVSGGCQHKIRYETEPHIDLRKRDSPPRHLESAFVHTEAGRSNAPVILIVVPKAEGVVDAFWFFFYSFNEGPGVLGTQFGNHGGDWEHTTIRFKDGRPTLAFLSSHNLGTALPFHVLEKYFINSTNMFSSWANSSAPVDFARPVVYSAKGSHAMYATTGEQPYVLPWDMLKDQTDRGPLWDPLLNVKSYTYDPENDTLRPSVLNPRAPTYWFHFAGRWGAQGLPDSDSRQYSLFGEQHFKIGPKGPKYKRLDRTEICASLKRKCRIRRLPNLT